MSEFVVLCGESRGNWNSRLREADIFREPKALLERIGDDPGEIRWVAIAADYRGPEGGPSDIAQRIRDLDPAVGVVLLRTDWTFADGWDAAAAVLATDADLSERQEAQRILRETQRRAFEAEKLASIAALTAGITHDVGTPMTAILGYAELIAKSVGDDKNRKRASTIVEQVHRVSDLIGTLMNLSRTEQSPPIPVELAGVLDKALDFYREKFKRHAIEIERHYAQAPQILGDPNRLHQVLLSLLLNALEAMPQGGILRVSLAATDTGEAEVRVSDTGTGIDPELRAQIFEPYFSTKRRSSGTGLGLLVARTIVEEHGGRLDLSSASDRGTEFRLSFPPLAPRAP